MYDKFKQTQESYDVFLFNMETIDNKAFWVSEAIANGLAEGHDYFTSITIEDNKVTVNVQSRARKYVDTTPYTYLNGVATFNGEWIIKNTSPDNASIHQTDNQ